MRLVLSPQKSTNFFCKYEVVY